MENPTEQQSEIIDLGFDVNESDVKKPLLKKGPYRARCLKVYRKPPNANGNVFLSVEWEIVEEVPADKNTAGRVLPAGFKPWPQRVMMNPSGGLTEEMIREKLQQIHFALAGEGRVSTAPWVGKEAILSISLREAGADKQGVYREASNEIDRVNPLPKK